MAITNSACAEMAAPKTSTTCRPKGERGRKGTEPQVMSAEFWMTMPIITVPMMTVTTGRSCKGRNTTP